MTIYKWNSYSYLTHDDDEEEKLAFPIAYWLLDMHGFFGLFAIIM